MGLTYADIALTNFADETLFEDGYLPEGNIRKLPVQMLADSGALRLAINEYIKEKLGLRIRNTMDVTLADGTKKSLQVAGPIKVRFKERDCITDAFVLPGNEEPLLGAVPMELMDLAIIPSEQIIDYNPKHPEGPIFSLKKI